MFLGYSKQIFILSVMGEEWFQMEANVFQNINSHQVDYNYLIKFMFQIDPLLKLGIPIS
jgi:hypothetical protein